MNAREKLAKVVGELLEIGTANRSTLPHKIVAAIVKAMTDALQRGETVTIDGFGIFKLIAGRRRTPCPVVYGGRRKTYYSWYMKELPDRKRVLFKPSKVLKRMLSGN